MLIVLVQGPRSAGVLPVPHVTLVVVRFDFTPASVDGGSKISVATHMIMDGVTSGLLRLVFTVAFPRVVASPRVLSASSA